MTIRTVAVIGAGTQGRDFALRSVAAGFTTILEDVMPAKLRRAEEQAEDAVHSGRLRLALTVEDAVRDADLAVDFVPDELESKLEIFSLLDRMAPPRTILCTPTQTLGITDLGSCTYRPDRCVGLRPEGTSLLAGTVGLVAGRETSTETLNAVSAWLAVVGIPSEPAPDRDEPMLVKNLPGVGDPA